MEPKEKIVDMLLANPGWNLVWKDSETKELFIGEPIVAWARIRGFDGELGDYEYLEPMVVNELGRYVDIEESRSFGILGPGENINKYSHIL